MVAEGLQASNAQPVGRNCIWHIISTSVPAVLFTLFAYAHTSHWIESGDLTGLGFALQELVLVGLFLTRRSPSRSLNTPLAWLAAIVGTWGILFLRPTGNSVLGLESVYMSLQLVGAALAIGCTLYLGRSFGIVAANRGVKTEGAYRLVRHPIYASYVIGFAGYLLAFFSIWNVLVIGVTMAFQLKRIFTEESVLMWDPEYRAYADRVRYRLVPWVF